MWITVSSGTFSRTLATCVIIIIITININTNIGMKTKAKGSNLGVVGTLPIQYQLIRDSKA